MYEKRWIVAAGCATLVGLGAWCAMRFNEEVEEAVYEDPKRLVLSDSPAVDRAQHTLISIPVSSTVASSGKGASIRSSRRGSSGRSNGSARRGATFCFCDWRCTRPAARYLLRAHWALAWNSSMLRSDSSRRAWDRSGWVDCLHPFRIRCGSVRSPATRRMSTVDSPERTLKSATATTLHSRSCAPLAFTVTYAPRAPRSIACSSIPP